MYNLGINYHIYNYLNKLCALYKSEFVVLDIWFDGNTPGAEAPEKGINDTDFTNYRCRCRVRPVITKVHVTEGRRLLYLVELCTGRIGCWPYCY